MKIRVRDNIRDKGRLRVGNRVGLGSNSNPNSNLHAARETYGDSHLSVCYNSYFIIQIGFRVRVRIRFRFSTNPNPDNNTYSNLTLTLALTYFII